MKWTIWTTDENKVTHLFKEGIYGFELKREIRQLMYDETEFYMRYEKDEYERGRKEHEKTRN